MVALLARRGGEGEGIGAGTGFGKRVGTHRAGSEAGKIFRLLLVAGPAMKRVVHDGVLHIDDDAGGGVDRGDFLDGEHALEEIAALSAVLFRDFDGHEAKIEELADQVFVEDGGVIHLADERARCGRAQIDGPCRGREARRG